MNADLDQDYERAGFAGRLAFGKRPALLIVDLVRAYTDPASGLYLDAAAAVASNTRISDRARKQKIPVIYTQVVYDDGGITGGLFYKKIPALRSFTGTTQLGEFAPEVAPQPTDLIVQKQYASAFFGTSLASTLRALEVDCLLITGFSTSGCVRATAVDAIQHGFAPFVIRDACADRDPAPHEASLFDLQAKYAEVISESQALGLILQER